MNELLTLNVFAQSWPLAVAGVALSAGLIALPWWPRGTRHDAPATCKPRWTAASASCD